MRATIQVVKEVMTCDVCHREIDPRTPNLETGAYLDVMRHGPYRLNGCSAEGCNQKDICNDCVPTFQDTVHYIRRTATNGSRHFVFCPAHRDAFTAALAAVGITITVPETVETKRDS